MESESRLTISRGGPLKVNNQLYLHTVKYLLTQDIGKDPWRVARQMAERGITLVLSISSVFIST